jgi:hypothetical protein
MATQELSYTPSTRRFVRPARPSLRVGLDALSDAQIRATLTPRGLALYEERLQVIARENAAQAVAA